jgi:hypothetical protein
MHPANYYKYDLIISRMQIRKNEYLLNQFKRQLFMRQLKLVAYISTLILSMILLGHFITN